MRIVILIEGVFHENVKEQGFKVLRYYAFALCKCYFYCDSFKTVLIKKVQAFNGSCAVCAGTAHKTAYIHVLSMLLPVF